MDITSSNFLARFPQILNAYNKCSIIAVDGEFSGAKFDQDLAVETYRGILSEEHLKLLEESWDMPGMETAYQKLRWVVRRFALLQLGITFAWPAKDEKGCPILKTESYSFLISPLVDGRINKVKLWQTIQRVVSMNTNSVKFLNHLGFDFEGLFKNGLPYLTHPEEAELRRALGQSDRGQRNGNEENDVNKLRGKEARERDRIRAIIESRMAARRNSRGLSIPLDPPKDMDMDLDDWKTLVHHVVDQDFPRCRVTNGRPGPGVVIKLVELERTHNVDDLARKHNIEADIRKAIGARSLLDMLIGNDIRTQIQPQDIAKAQLAAERQANRQPARINTVNDPELKARTEALEELFDAHWKRQQPILIGHNLGWDLAFMIGTLFEPPQDTFAEFLPRVDGLFSRILDTRIITDASMPEAKEMNLSQIVAQLKYRSVEPRCQSESGLGYDDSDGRPHDAAYDSFLTVEAFARLGQDLIRNKCWDDGAAFPTQEEMNERIMNWRDPIWDPFRGQFKVMGELVREMQVEGGIERP